MIKNGNIWIPPNIVYLYYCRYFNKCNLFVNILKYNGYQTY